MNERKTKGEQKSEVYSNVGKIGIFFVLHKIINLKIISFSGIIIHRFLYIVFEKLVLVFSLVTSAFDCSSTVFCAIQMLCVLEMWVSVTLCSLCKSIVVVFHFKCKNEQQKHLFLYVAVVFVVFSNSSSTTTTGITIYFV